MMREKKECVCHCDGIALCGCCFVFVFVFWSDKVREEMRDGEVLLQLLAPPQPRIAATMSVRQENSSSTRSMKVNRYIRMMQGFLSGGDVGATGQENIGAIWRWISASRNAGSDMKCSHSSHSAVNPVINLKYQPLRSMLKACHSLIRTNQIFTLVPDF